MSDGTTCISSRLLRNGDFVYRLSLEVKGPTQPAQAPEAPMEPNADVVRPNFASGGGPDVWLVRLAPHELVTNFASADLEDEAWVPAQCTVDGVRAIHPHVRNALTLGEPHRAAVHVCLHHPPGSDHCGFADFLRKRNLEVRGAIDVLKYRPGGFHARHTDTHGSFTCLVFPRGQQCTGGQLVLYTETGEVAFDPAGREHDTIVVFSGGVPHEVLPVTGGTRVVFKFPLERVAAPPVVRGGGGRRD